MYFERGPDNGDRRPIAVVAALHDDEPCGVYAIAEFLASHSILKRQVRFIIANERALEAGEHCIDDNLNWAFSGNPTSNFSLDETIDKVICGMDIANLVNIRYIDDGLKLIVSGVNIEFEPTDNLGIVMIAKATLKSHANPS